MLSTAKCLFQLDFDFLSKSIPEIPLQTASFSHWNSIWKFTFFIWLIVLPDSLGWMGFFSSYDLYNCTKKTSSHQINAQVKEFISPLNLLLNYRMFNLRWCYLYIVQPVATKSTLLFVYLLLNLHAIWCLKVWFMF